MVEDKYPDKYKTTDLSLCAFIELKDHKLLDMNQLRHGRGEFIFDITIEEGRKLALEFSNSEFARFDLLRRKLSKLTY